MDSGGVESVVLNYYNLIDTTQVQFDFFVDEKSKIPQKAQILEKCGRIFLLPSYSNVVKYCVTLARYLKQNNYMIVHSHLSSMSVLPLGVAFCVGVPIRIAHSHSMANIYEFKKSILKLLLRGFSKVFATEYFACGEVAGRWLFSNKTYEQGKVFIMENIIDYKKFAYSQECRTKIFSEFNINSELVVGHIGRFCKQKNQLYLLEIFAKILKRVPSAVLILVGEGELELKIKEKADKLQITNSIIFAGVRTDPEKFYSSFDIFLLPSLYEGMPVVSVEANANGLPMVTTKGIDSNNYAKTLPIGRKYIDIWADNAINFARKN